LKVIYGLTTDNLPIFGYRRRPYIWLLTFIQFASLMAIFIIDPEEPLTLALMLMLTSFSLAGTMVVSEAIMVQ
jgi:MFS-type transporter involved in bile tolerance (Atg22 family)